MIRTCLMLTVVIFFLAVSPVHSEMKQSRLELDFGTSYNLAKFNQILNPEAGKNLEPVEGFEGMAAQKTYEKYYKNFEKPSKEPTFIMNIGDSGK